MEGKMTTKDMFILVWPTCWTASCSTSIVCVCVCVCVCVRACVRACVRVCVCVRAVSSVLLGTWWMADYETLHVCPVPYSQQCVKFWWWPSDPIKFNCVCVSGDMSPYCSAHDEWLIMKLCMYVRDHTANNVSNFGGDPITFYNDI